MKYALDGSIIPQFDTISEAIKIIEEVFKITGASDHLSLWINFASYNYYNKDISKYEYENFKKPSDVDEIEDGLAKLLLDKKIIRVIQDPFILDHKVSWHRLNVGMDYSLVQTEREES